MTMRRGKAFRLAMMAGLMGNLAAWPVVPVRGDEPAVQAKGTPAKGDKEAAKPAPPKPKIAVFRLAGDVSELPPDETFSFGAIGGTSLRELLDRIKKAGEDPIVKAVVFLHEGGSVGMAQAEELRQAMAKVRAAGKEIYAHADSLSMREYVLLSGASRLSVVPTADLWIVGLFGEAPYLRGLLDKLGVRPEFLTCGSYKSAAEMFLRDGPSPEAEAMQNWLLDSTFETSLALIARGRNVEVAQVRKWIDGGPYTAEKARTAGLIDDIEHRQDFEAMLKSKYGADVVFDKKYGQKQQPTLDLSSPFAMFKLWGELLGQGQKKGPSKNAVGIVHVEGPITLGGGQASLFGEVGATSMKVRKALDDAARDPSIKAVVLRVNSPGGSAVASEIILDATKRVKAKKPFIVSMGDVAGSGGYYVACASDVIFADESTITASIGVVGGKLATSAMWKKVGVTFKSYKRGENAGLLTSGDPFTNSERQRVQAWMDDVYEVFKGHVPARSEVAASRSRSMNWPAAASSPAGRPWSSAWSTRSAASATQSLMSPDRRNSPTTTSGLSPHPRTSSSNSSRMRQGPRTTRPGSPFTHSVRTGASRPRWWTWPCRTSATSTRVESPRSRRPSSTSNSSNTRVSCS